MLLPILFSAIITGLVGVWYVYRRRKFGQFESLGFPGPKASFLFGNLSSLSDPQEMYNTYVKWNQEYGKIVRFYMGAHPHLLIADTELIKAIYIKDADKFSDRLTFIPIIQDATFKLGVSLANGDDWRRQRNILSPTFTTGKIKLLSLIMDKYTNVLMEKMELTNGQETNLQELYQRLTADVTASAALAIRVDALDEPNGPIFKSLENFFAFGENKFVMTIKLCFPELNGVLETLQSLKMKLLPNLKYLDNVSQLFQLMSSVVKHRQVNGQPKQADLVKLMMDAVASPENEDEEDVAQSLDLNSNDDHTKSKTTTKFEGFKNSTLSFDEVLANGVQLFIGGFESTSTALSFVTHVLLNHPEVQEKIREEITTKIGPNGEITYDTITGLDYLEAVINETLRVYPPVLGFVIRQATEDYTCPDGRMIPKGTATIANLLAVHNDPENYEEPDKFKPERFLRIRPNPAKWLPFGTGPRNCLGMRFALIEMKMTIAKLLQRFKIEPSESTVIGECETTIISDVILRPKRVYGKVIKI